MNIIEAAKAWKEGKIVTKGGEFIRLTPYGLRIFDPKDSTPKNDCEAAFFIDVDDLLADDWEIADLAMDKALREAMQAIHFPDNIMRATAETFFRKAWKAAKEHFTVYGDKQL